MQATFPRALAAVLLHEGGWSDHPRDPGGATQKGITLAVYSDWLGRKATKADLRAITDAEVAEIYAANYWRKIHGDKLPAGVDYATFDAAVNSGPARGAKWLQLAVRATPDGEVGPGTIKAANAADTASTIRAMCASRMKFLRALSTWPTFGKGWERRVNEVEAMALAMVGAKPAPVPVPSPPDVEPIVPSVPAKSWLSALVGFILSLFGKK